MKFTAVVKFSIAVATGSGNAIALPRENDGDFARVAARSETSCNKDAIDTCVASTGQTSTTCFGHLCAGRPLEKITKRQDDCTEDNLLQCAIMDWNEAQACFQQFCLS
ncbi:hypothetical protein F5Y19DRAFT_284343 [Xylariaceae sp. FL1651]|nr:hypothetical protein F5Y19DRAFT_284343 [Xylariaceae sp. FL1651]